MIISPQREVHFNCKIKKDTTSKPEREVHFNCKIKKDTTSKPEREVHFNCKNFMRNFTLEIHLTINSISTKKL